MSLLNLVIIVRGISRVAIDIIKARYVAKYSSCLCTETEKSEVANTPTKSRTPALITLNSSDFKPVILKLKINVDKKNAIQT
jgi:hypothetical protein